MQMVKNISDYVTHVREKSKIVNKSGLYMAFTFISVYAFIMSIVCFIKEDITMGVVNLVISLFMVLTMLVFAKIKSARILSWCVVLFLYVLMMFFMYEGGVGGVSIMWLLFVPMGGMALINLYYGGILSLLIGISIPLYMMTPLHYWGYQYSEDYRIRFPIIYWAFLIMAIVIFVRIDRDEGIQKMLIKKADEANRSKSEFLANMSHEIRTPLNAIMGLCEINLNEDVPRIVRENSESIYSSGKSLMNVINDLLDFSKAEAGSMELHCREYKLSDVLNDVIYMAVARKGNKDLSIVVDCDPDIPNCLYGDEVRLRQIILNLLTNAIKYTQKGGFFFRITCRKEEYGINLIFSVKDTGIGIKKEHLAEIFAAYGRVDAEKNYTVEGTGLGLPLTKKLIKLMNGTIQVKSTYGKGTEFKVVIPQKVVEQTPIVSFDKTEDIHILYFNKEALPEFVENSFSESFQTVLERLQAYSYSCKSIDDFRAQITNGDYSHLIIGKEEYWNNKDYFDEISKQYCLAVLQDRTSPVAVADTVLNIYKPFYTRNFIDFIKKPMRYKGQNETEDFMAFSEAKILVVDDNMINLEVVAGHLRMYQLQVDTAMSGMEALEMLKQKQYDLVFMDHLMPEMDGIETHRKIRLMEKDYVKTLPVIALTAGTEGEVRELFRQEGFQDFMSKPIQSERMKEVLRKWLSKE